MDFQFGRKLSNLVFCYLAKTLGVGHDHGRTRARFGPVSGMLLPHGDLNSDSHKRLCTRDFAHRALMFYIGYGESKNVV